MCIEQSDYHSLTICKTILFTIAIYDAIFHQFSYLEIINCEENNYIKQYKCNRFANPSTKLHFPVKYLPSFISVNRPAELD